MEQMEIIEYMLKLEDRVSNLEKQISEKENNSAACDKREAARRIVNEFLTWRESVGLRTPEGMTMAQLHGSFKDWAAIEKKDVDLTRGTLRLVTNEACKRYGLRADTDTFATCEGSE